MTDTSLTQQVFRTIFLERKWKSKQSISGSGSSLKATEILREELAKILSELEVRTFVDAPCGDCNWIRALEYTFDEYVGIDIVPELIERLGPEITTPNWRFQVGDVVVDDLPRADAFFCRDCLVHLPLEFGLRAIANWKRAGFRYVIVTTFPGAENIDVRVGRWRKLNLQAPPFNFPEPVATIRERAPDPSDPNNAKSLGIWRTQDLPSA